MMLPRSPERIMDSEARRGGVAKQSWQRTAIIRDLLLLFVVLVADGGGVEMMMMTTIWTERRPVTYQPLRCVVSRFNIVFAVLFFT